MQAGMAVMVSVGSIYELMTRDAKKTFLTLSDENKRLKHLLIVGSSHRECGKAGQAGLPYMGSVISHILT